MLFSDKAVGEISDSELSQNVAASGGTTSRAGALSLWSSSSLTLVRCVLQQNMALLGGEVSEGGGICVQESSLVLVDSDLRGNYASKGGRVSRGGLISLVAPSLSNITGCTLADNHAALGGMESLGGAVYADAGASRLQLASSRVLQNLAHGSGRAAGGAVYSAETVEIRIADSELRQNQADGSQAEGGAVWSAAESLHATNVTLSSNTAVAHGLDASALGGALFQQALSEASTLSLEGCSITDNLARVAGMALRASGGALHCATKAIARLVSCSLQRNAAGGKGKLRSQPRWYGVAIAEQLESAAMHIYSSGSVSMDRCRMIESTRLTGVEHPMWYWIVAQGGRLTLHDSVFETSVTHFYDPCPFASDGTCNANSDCPRDGDWDDCGSTPPPDAGPLGKLVNVRSPEAELVVRGSEVTNLTLMSVSLVGAVNSTFDPPLQPAQAVQPNPACGIVRAGQVLCDPRALCTPARSGGVECACVGDGLDSRPGFPADGQQCRQKTSLSLLTQTRRVTLSVQKPSYRAAAVAIVLTAAGETGFDASYNVSMRRVRPTDGASRLQSGNSTAREWSSIDEQRMLMDGHHLLWEDPLPSANSAVDLSLDAGRFSFSRTFALSIELNCTAGEPCVEDGDVVHTLVAVASAADGLVSEVVISTAVESLVSCDLSRGRIEGLMADKASVSALSTIKVHIEACDCDGLPIRYTRADIQFSFSNQPLAVTWNRGSNKYTADVPTELTAQPGLYALVVTASNAWNKTAGQTARCDLLRRNVRIVSVVTTVNVQTIILGVLVGLAMLALGALLGCQIRAHKEKAKLFVESFFKHEGQLAFKICWDGWVRPSLHVVPRV
jgi:hypothetical protein